MTSIKNFLPEDTPGKNSKHFVSSHRKLMHYKSKPFLVIQGLFFLSNVEVVAHVLSEHMVTLSTWESRNTKKSITARSRCCSLAAVALFIRSFIFFHFQVPKYITQEEAIELYFSLPG